MTELKPRLLNAAGFLVCAGLMAFALYAEYVLYLMPCPLCTFQRLGVILIGLVFLVAALHNPSGIGRRVYAALLSVAAAATAGVAGYHIWMQGLPADEVPTCGAPVSEMLQTLPLLEVLEKVFTGSGSCADIDWAFLGVSMPGWVLIWALLLGGLGLWANLGRRATPQTI